MIKIIVADDHQMFIEGITSLLSGNKKFSIVGEAHNGQQALLLIETMKPNLVLLDINMPVMDGLQTLKVIREKHPNVKVIMLTMFDTRDYIQRLLKAGADGYILKNTGRAELNLGIETVMKGQSFFSNEVIKLVMEGLQGKKTKSNTVKVELTQRETEVLKLIVKELTTQEIADALFISPNTVETHRKNLISKLGVRSLAGLVKYAMQNGLAD